MNGPLEPIPGHDRWLDPPSDPREDYCKANEDGDPCDSMIEYVIKGLGLCEWHYQHLCSAERCETIVECHHCPGKDHKEIFCEEHRPIIEIEPYKQNLEDSIGD